jgi:hypothetical protein
LDQIDVPHTQNFEILHPKGALVQMLTKKGLTVNVTETYTRKQFLSQNKNLSMHVCKATIQDYKKNISKILSFFLIFENFSSEKWQGFLSKA